MTGVSSERIYLSPPHLEGDEAEAVMAAMRSGWIAPAGPDLAAFESEFCAVTGNRHSVALASCTAALHLALLLCGLGVGDEVLCSTFTFVASATPILFAGAKPVFVDSEEASWNLCPHRLEEAIHDRIRKTGRAPKALMLVHIYGQSADLDAIARICDRHGVVLVEDAAEAVGCIYRSAVRGEIAPGTVGRVGGYSFNGNKILTTSGGGMLTTADAALAERARHLSTQARVPAVHYEHREVGYNYRMSNLLAAVGRAQLRHLGARVEARRWNYEQYRRGLGDLPGLGFMPEAPWNRSTRWLTCITIDPAEFGATRDEVQRALEASNIEARPTWKPMHQQPLFSGCEVTGGAVADSIFERGLCLPSGSNLGFESLERVVSVVRSCCRSAG